MVVNCVKVVNVLGRKCYLVMIIGLYEDIVFEFENWFEKFIDWIDVLYEELFFEKRYKIVGKCGGGVKKERKFVFKIELFEG